MSPANPCQAAEHRRWPRSCEELLITCRHSSHLDQTTYFTRNISAGGLMFESPEPIPTDTQLEIELYAPMDCEKRTMQHMLIKTRVLWACEMTGAFEYEGSNRYKVGVVFDPVAPQDQACLDEYVRKRLMMASAQHVT